MGTQTSFPCNCLNRKGIRANAMPLPKLHLPKFIVYVTANALVVQGLINSKTKNLCHVMPFSGWTPPCIAHLSKTRLYQKHGCMPPWVKLSSERYCQQNLRAPLVSSYQNSHQSQFNTRQLCSAEIHGKLFVRMSGESSCTYSLGKLFYTKGVLSSENSSASTGKNQVWVDISNRLFPSLLRKEIRQYLTKSVQGQFSGGPFSATSSV